LVPRRFAFRAMSDPSLPRIILRVLGGMIAGNLAAALQFLGIVEISQRFAGGRSWLKYASPSLVFVAVTGGFAAAWVWRKLGATAFHTLMCSLGATAVGLAGAAVFLGEGIVCLVMAGPLYFLLFFAGAEAGRRFFQRDNRLRLTIIPLLFVLSAIELGARRSHSGVVVDELVIAAPPEKVWPHVLAFRDIEEPPDFWLFRLGLPYPVLTTNGGDSVGADRACEFSGGAVFRERIVAFEPHRRLTFDIVESPRHPELVGHLDPRRGEFLLRDNGDGTTTLIGSTWYSLHVSPASYFDRWTHHVFSAVHLRVMRHIQRLAEDDA
jgi:hypothetical protein